MGSRPLSRSRAEAELVRNAADATAGIVDCLLPRLMAAEVSGDETGGRIGLESRKSLPGEELRRIAFPGTVPQPVAPRSRRATPMTRLVSLADGVPVGRYASYDPRSPNGTTVRRTDAPNADKTCGA
jgi:hypothetical protein